MGSIWTSSFTYLLHWWSHFLQSIHFLLLKLSPALFILFVVPRESILWNIWSSRHEIWVSDLFPHRLVWSLRSHLFQSWENQIVIWMSFILDQDLLRLLGWRKQFQLLVVRFINSIVYLCWCKTHLTGVRGIDGSVLRLIFDLQLRVKHRFKLLFTTLVLQLNVKWSHFLDRFSSVLIDSVKSFLLLFVGWCDWFVFVSFHQMVCLSIKFSLCLNLQILVWRLWRQPVLFSNPWTLSFRSQLFSFYFASNPSLPLHLWKREQWEFRHVLELRSVSLETFNWFLLLFTWSVLLQTKLGLCRE